MVTPDHEIEIEATLNRYTREWRGSNERGREGSDGEGREGRERWRGREGNDIGGRKGRLSFIGTHCLWVGVVVGHIRSPFVGGGSLRPWVFIIRLWGVVIVRGWGGGCCPWVLFVVSVGAGSSFVGTGSPCCG